MKLLPSYLCLLAIIFQVSLASSSVSGKGASLSSSKVALFKSGKSRSKAKPVVGRLVCKKKLPSTKAKTKGVCKSDNRKNVMIKENKPKLLIDLLLKELVEIVIGYLNDDTYPFIVSTHNWVLDNVMRIAVDGARLYMITWESGIKGLDHSLGNVNEYKQIYSEFGDPYWFYYWQFASSDDGQYVFFNHAYKNLTDLNPYTEGIKWLAQGNESEDRKPKHVNFDDIHLNRGILSRDGRILLSYTVGHWNNITSVYQINGDTKKNPTAFMKFELNGTALAISGKGNRAIVLANWPKMQIHDISKDASKLVCQIDLANFSYIRALNEDGSEAAFVSYTGDELQIVKVDKADQPAIVTIKVPKSTGPISKLVYTDRNKLHVLHDGGKVSLFDPLKKEIILLETPQKGQRIDNLAISPNADYIAFLQKCKVKDQPFAYTTIVKRKLKDTDWKALFGYENPSRCVKASAALPEKANLTQACDALSQSTFAPLTRLPTIPVQGGSLCAFDGNLKHRYVLNDDLAIHRKAIDSGADRGSVKLPAAVVKGYPQYLQTNSDGTVFYLATRMNKKRYIYVIDVARKRAYEHYLDHLESDIVEIRAHLDAKIVEVTLQDQAVLIFSCESQRLCLLNKLMEGERLVDVSQSIVVFEEREYTGLTTIGYFDITKANASLYSLPYRNAKFVALDKNDVYLINAKSIVRFNVKTKETAIIKKHYVARSSHVHNGSIRIVDHDFVYRVLDIRAFRQLHEIHLLSFDQQEDNTRTLISSDGQRVMVSQPDVAHLFEIVDPKLLHKMQAIENIKKK